MAARAAVGDRAAMRQAREIWIQVVQQFQKSGLTQEAFAEQRNIPLSTLRSWIYGLRREREDEVPMLPVRMVASPAPTARQQEEGGAVEVELGGAVRLRFAAGTAPGLIAEIIALLRDRC